MTRRATPTSGQLPLPPPRAAMAGIEIGDNVRWPTANGFREGRLIEWRPAGAAFVLSRGRQRVVMADRVQHMTLCEDAYNRRRLAERGAA